MQTFVKRAWYLAAWSSDLGVRPFSRMICGEEIALYRDAAGKVHALGGVCPHRGASLGLGRAIGSVLQCPFHGWQFDPSGRCVQVPSQPPSAALPRRARVPVYPAVERQGCIWIWPCADETPSEPAPSYEFFAQDESLGLLRSSAQLIRSDFASVVENALDESHIPFVHPRTLPVATPQYPRMIVERHPDGRGMTARWDPDSPWGRELFTHHGQPPGISGRLISWRYGRFLFHKRTWSFRFGGIVVFREVFERGGRAFVVSSATPMDAHHTWYASAFAHPMVRAPWIPARLIRSRARQIIDEDRTATEALLRPPTPDDPLLSVPADVATLSFRRLYAAALRAEPALPAQLRAAAPHG